MDESENQLNTNHGEEPNRGKYRNLIILTVVLAVVIAIASSMRGELANTSPTATSTVSNPLIDDIAWIPSGYTQTVDDPTIAWRWGTSAETNCTYSSGACWSMMVVSKNGCPTELYGEISIFDKSDVQIDYTNATTSTVAALQPVKLTFDSFNEQADTAKFSKLECN